MRADVGLDVELAALRFAYPGGFSLALDRLSIATGEAIAVTGASGSGKTTLLQLLAGILAPDAGHVRVGGRELSELGERERRALRIERMGLVFQEFELLEHLTLRENVLVPYLLGPTHYADTAARGRAQELASAVGLAAALDRKPRALSQGERQRAAVCRALVTRPGLLLADEPTGSLDVANARAVVRLLLGACRDGGATLLCVTHDATLLSEFDRVFDLDSVNGGTA